MNISSFFNILLFRITNTIRLSAYKNCVSLLKLNVGQRIKKCRISMKLPCQFSIKGEMIALGLSGRIANRNYCLDIISVLCLRFSFTVVI